MVGKSPDISTIMIEKVTMQEYFNSLQEVGEYRYMLGLDTNNNPCRGKVAGIRIPIGGYSATYYPIPKYLFKLSKNDADNKIFTITLCKLYKTSTGESYDFKLSSLQDYSSNNRSGFILFTCNENNQFLNHSEVCAGNFSNVREITYNGASYMAVDVLCQQYGHCYITLTGLHNHIADIMDVTGNFTEAGA